MKDLFLVPIPIMVHLDETQKSQHLRPRSILLSWCPREELNLNFLLRREISYPLNDEGVGYAKYRMIKKIYRRAAQYTEMEYDVPHNVFRRVSNRYHLTIIHLKNP